MISESTDAVELLANVKAGDQPAASDLFHRFASRLVVLARRRLDSDLQRKIDPEDVVQSVFGSFFRRHRADQIDVQNWESLWSLLAVITVHKCGHHIRYYRAAKRNARQEQDCVRFTEDSAVHWEAVASDPGPPHIAMLNEAMTELMQSLDWRDRQILTLTLQGYSAEEVSSQINRSMRTVRRVLDRIRSNLESQCANGP